MSTQTYADARDVVDPSPIPDDLASAETKLVYLYLTVAEGATVEDLNADLGLRKLSLFPVLDTLDERGLVERDDGRYRAVSS